MECLSVCCDSSIALRFLCFLRTYGIRIALHCIFQAFRHRKRVTLLNTKSYYWTVEAQAGSAGDEKEDKSELVGGGIVRL